MLAIKSHSPSSILQKSFSSSLLNADVPQDRNAHLHVTGEKEGLDRRSDMIKVKVASRDFTRCVPTLPLWPPPTRVTGYPSCFGPRAFDILILR